MKNIGIAIRLTLITLLILSLVYPMVIWGFGNLLTPHSAQGSLIHDPSGKTPVGSELIGQSFTQPQYFWPRPSAVDYNAAAAGASNFGPSNPKLTQRVKETITRYNLRPGQQITSDLVAASGSGLDPHITVSAAYFQVHRVAEQRHVSEMTIKKIIDTLAFDPSLAWTGRRIVNVLQLNLELDKSLIGGFQ